TSGASFADHFQMDAAPVSVEASSHYNLAQQHLASRNFDQAESELHAAIAVDPTYTEAHILLGRLSQEACNLEEPIAHYYRALSLSPNHRPLHDAILVALHYPGTFSREQIFTEHLR